MGPLMNQGAVQKVAALVDAAKAQGAQVLTGGRVADRGRHAELLERAGAYAALYEAQFAAAAEE